MSAGLCAAVAHGRLQGVHDRVAGARWALGTAVSSAGTRTCSPAPLEAAAAAALGAGGQTVSAPPAGEHTAPRRGRYPGRSPPGAGRHRLAGQHGGHRAGEPRDSPARGGGRPARHHALQRRSRLTPAVNAVADIPQLLLAACGLPPTVASVPADQRGRLSQTLAALYAGDGHRVDRSCLLPEGGPVVSSAAVAATTGVVSSRCRR
jgi:hypothetical protein